MKLLLASALVALAVPALAQPSVAPRVDAAFAPSPSAVASGDAEWALRVGPRLVDRIGSPSWEVRTGALHVVGNLAYTSADGADLRPAIPALLTVFRSDPDWRLRVMALRSLEASGGEEVMTALRREAWREAQRGHPVVRRVLFFVLVDHYGLDALRHDADVEALRQAVIADGRVARR